jgi:hypothetical protein
MAASQTRTRKVLVFPLAANINMSVASSGMRPPAIFGALGPKPRGFLFIASAVGFFWVDSFYIPIDEIVV